MFFSVILSMLIPIQQAVAPGSSKQVIVQEAPSALEFLTNEGDMRLNMACRLRCKNETLRDVLKTLQRQTGVVLRVEGEEFAELGMTANVHSLPLHTILRRLAHLHNLTWRRDILPATTADTQSAAAASPRYVLYQTLTNRRYIERLRRMSWEPLHKKVAQYREYAGFTDEKLKNLADMGDLLAGSMQNPNTRASVTLAGLVSEEMLDQLIARHSITLPFDQLAADSQAALTSYVDARNAQQAEGYADAVLLAQRLGVQPLGKQNPGPDPRSFRVNYRVQGTGTSANLQLLFEYANGAYSGHLPFVAGGAASTWIKDKFMEARRGVLPANRMDARHVPVALKVSDTDWADTVFLFADKWNLNLFSDAYAFIPMDRMPPRLAQSFSTRMLFEDGPQAASLWQRVWWQEGSEGKDILFLRGEWYDLRDGGKATRIIRRLKAGKARQEPPALEDLAEASELEGAQIGRVEEATGVDLTMVQIAAPLLKFYAALEPADKMRLQKQGIDYWHLTSTRRNAFLNLISSLNARLPDDTIHALRLRLSVEKKRSRFFFETTTGSDNPLMEVNRRVSGVPQSILTPAASAYKE